MRKRMLLSFSFQKTPVPAKMSEQGTAFHIPTTTDSRIASVAEVKQVTDGMQKAFAAFMAAKKAQG